MKATPHTAIPGSPLRNGRFLALLGGQGMSYFGNSISSIVLPILILTMTGSGFIMGAIGALEVVPLFVIGLPAGVWVDRWNRNTVLLVADFSRFILVGLIPMAALLHVSLLPVVAIVMVLTGSLAVFFDAAFAAIIPSTVPPEQMGRANGYIEAIESLAFALGPSLGGFLTTKVGPATTLGIDSLSFLASALMIMRLRTPRLASTSGNVLGEMTDAPGTPDVADVAGTAGTAGTPDPFLADMFTGLRMVMKDRAMRGITLLWGFNRLAFTALIPAVTFFVLKTLHGNSAQVGIAISVYAVGSLLGTLLPTRTPPGYEVLLSISGQGLMVVSSLAMGFSGGFISALVSSFVLGVGEGIVLVCYLTYRANNIPEQALGRVASSSSMLTQAMGTVGLLAVGTCLSAFGGHATWVILGILSVLGSLPLVTVRRRAPES